MLFIYEQNIDAIIMGTCISAIKSDPLWSDDLVRKNGPIRTNDPIMRYKYLETVRGRKEVGAIVIAAGFYIYVTLGKVGVESHRREAANLGLRFDTLDRCAIIRQTFSPITCDHPRIRVVKFDYVREKVTETIVFFDSLVIFILQTPTYVDDMSIQMARISKLTRAANDNGKMCVVYVNGRKFVYGPTEKEYPPRAYNVGEVENPYII